MLISFEQRHSRGMHLRYFEGDPEGGHEPGEGSNYASYSGPMSRNWNGSGATGGEPPGGEPPGGEPMGLPKGQRPEPNEIARQLSEFANTPVSYNKETGEYTSRNGFGNFFDNTYGKLGPLGLSLPGGVVASILNKVGLGSEDAVFGGPVGLAGRVANSLGAAGGGDGGDGPPSRSYGHGPSNQYAQSQQNVPVTAAATTSILDPNSAAAWFKLNPGAHDVAIRKAQDANKWSAEDVAKALGTDTAHWSARYNAATPYFNFGSMMDEALAGDLSGFGSFMNQRVPPAKRSA